MGKYSRLILAAIMVVSFAQYAAAQPMSYSIAGYGYGYSYRASPEVNLYLSARYDHLLQTRPGFRAYRMWKECRTINLPPLQADCLASFDQYEPILAGYAWRFWRYY